MDLNEVGNGSSYSKITDFRGEVNGKGHTEGQFIVLALTAVLEVGKGGITESIHRGIKGILGPQVGSGSQSTNLMA